MRKHEVVIRLDGTRFVLSFSTMLHEAQYSWDTERHCNGDYEMHSILSGHCLVNVDNHLYDISAGDTILIAPGQYHKPQNVSSDFCRLSLSFSLSGAMQPQIVHEIMPCKVIRLPACLQQVARQLIAEVSQTSPFQAEMLNALGKQLLIGILRDLKITQGTAKESTFADWRTGVIDDYFEKRASAYGTESELAELLHLSRRQLTRVLQTNYGMNFRQKLLSARMEHAGWLLRSTQKSVTEVCDAVGYTSEAMFYKNFKTYHGMTPLLYRKTHK